MTRANVRTVKHAPKSSQRQRAKPLPVAERREQLLSVARRLIQEGGGISALTMSALSERSGASKPVVYEHWKNSEAVAVALLEDYFETMIDRVDARTKDAQTLDEYLSIAIDTQFEFHREDKLVVRSITNGHSSGNRLNAVYLKVKRSSVETLQELLQQQGASPETSKAAGYILSEMISSAVFEFAVLPNAESEKNTLKQMVVGAVHAIVVGAGTKPMTPAKTLELSKQYKRSKKK